MKKNGFTLVELLATIVLLGMLATILITTSIKNTNKVKEYSRQSMIDSIELAAKNYVMHNESDIPDFNTKNFAYITLATLIENEQFTASLIDQTKDQALPITDKVYVTKSSSGIITAKYDIDQNSKPTIVLNGSYNEYIKKGKTYIDLGATATSSNGDDLTNSILVANNVNTEIPNTYIVRYSIGDTSVTRNVIVFK